jgi:hypothetical protein
MYFCKGHWQSNREEQSVFLRISIWEESRQNTTVGKQVYHDTGRIYFAYVKHIRDPMAENIFVLEYSLSRTLNSVWEDSAVPQESSVIRSDL